MKNRAKSLLVACLCGLLLRAASAQQAVTVTIDVTKPGKTAATPVNFLGMFDASNIGKGNYNNSQSATYVPINAYYGQLQNLVNQMGIRHWRVEGGNATESVNDQFFQFIESTGCSGPSVEWGLYAYDVCHVYLNATDYPNNIGTNGTDLTALLGDTLATGLVDAFNFGNESDWPVNMAKDEYIVGYDTADGSLKSYGTCDEPSCSSDMPSDPSSGGFRGRWVQQMTGMQTVASHVGYTGALNFVGPDTGDIANVTDPTASLTAVPNGIEGTTPWTLQFVHDEAANIQQITQHLYVGDDAISASPLFVGSSTYKSGDQVYDGTNVDPYSLQPVLYQCNVSSYSSSTPPSQSSDWTSLEPAWSSIVTYPLGQVVRVTANKATTYYQCVVSSSLNQEPPNSSWIPWAGQPVWRVGGPYCVGDEVYDLGDTDPNTHQAVLYRCRVNTTGGNAPHNADSPTGYWTQVEVPWSSTATYNTGQVVRYQSGSATTYYQCVANATTGTPPPSDTNHRWIMGYPGNYAFQGPHQLAMKDSNSERLQDWQTAINAELNGNTKYWPSGMTFRMSEFSPFAGPNPGAVYGNCQEGSDPQHYSDSTSSNPDLLPTNGVPTDTACPTNCFASALTGLEMFHWWARKSCAGIDPISGTTAINSPIFQGPWGQAGGQFSAEPYAYAWPAFNLSGQPGFGQELWDSNGAISISNPGGYNLTAYAVLRSDNAHLVVTFFNKTFASDGLSGAEVLPLTIIPQGFNPASVWFMTLESGSSTPGDSTAMTCLLGGATLQNTNSTFPATWTSAGSAWNGTSFTVPILDQNTTAGVSAYSAIIVDFSASSSPAGGAGITVTNP